MRIGEREIGAGHMAYVIAEIGVNHDGDADRALALVDAAADAGADAVKLQYFEAERLMSRASRLAAYQAEAGERDPVEMLRRLELPVRDLARVVDRAHDRGIHAIVTVFSLELVGGAAELEWDAFKTASPDIIHRPMLEALERDGRPMIVSTGAADLDEVRRGAAWLRGARREDRLALLQCVSAYPTPDEWAAIGGIAALAEACDLPVGYSDHTVGVDTGALAVAHGACVLEKHLTYSNGAAGPDHGASLEPEAFAEYARLARAASPAHAPGAACAAAKGAATGEGGGAGGPAAGATVATPAGEPDDIRIGPPVKRILACERDVRSVSRQSLVSARALGAGRVIARGDLTIKRPGTGLAPFMLEDVIGRSLARAVDADMPLVEADLA